MKTKSFTNVYKIIIVLYYHSMIQLFLAQFGMTNVKASLLWNISDNVHVAIAMGFTVSVKNRKFLRCSLADTVGQAGDRGEPYHLCVCRLCGRGLPWAAQTGFVIAGMTFRTRREPLALARSLSRRGPPSWSSSPTLSRCSHPRSTCSRSRYKTIRQRPFRLRKLRITSLAFLFSPRFLSSLR